MCGILGIVSTDARPVSLTDAQVMDLRDRMRRRGPDDAGLARINPRAVLAHRRLAIRDPSQGQQPWVSADGRWTLVYNGELYNTEELRQLTSGEFPEPPRTHCDTELLLRTLQVYGARAPVYLRGMFAFAAYDAARQRLILARDRFGIKPLYYAERGHELLFASSPNVLSGHAGMTGGINPRALVHYLMTLRVTLGSETLREGILSLPPAHVLVQDRDGTRLERYWDYPVGNRFGLPEQEVTRLDAALGEAVRCRLVSDVPVGMMLSGGVDSCLLGSYVREELGPNFVAECGCGEPSAEQTESTWARASAALLGCDFRTVPVTERDYRHSWRELIAETGQPLATPSDVIIFHLARSLKQRVGVVLGGEGADELFGGYAAIHGLGLPGGELQPSSRGLVDRYLALAGLIPLAGLKLLLRQDPEESYREIHGYYSDRVQAAGGSRAGFSGLLGLLHRVNLESLLSRLDRATMAASLEARVPFTDHRLVEQFWNLPPDYCLRPSPGESPGGEGKWLLRQLAKQRLSASIADRAKASFPTPVPVWLGSCWSDWVRETIGGSPLLAELFEADPLQELAGNPAAAGLWLWPLLNLALWGETEFPG